MLETLLDSMFFFGSLSSSIRNYSLSHILVDSRPFLVGLFCGFFFLNVRVSFPLFFLDEMAVRKCVSMTASFDLGGGRLFC